MLAAACCRTPHDIQLPHTNIQNTAVDQAAAPAQHSTNNTGAADECCAGCTRAPAQPSVQDAAAEALHTSLDKQDLLTNPALSAQMSTLTVIWQAQAPCI